MESTLEHNLDLVYHILDQLYNACGLIIEWNKSIDNVDDYLSSPEGMQVMAASCMMLESVGEGAKKIDKLMPNFLESNAPLTPWKNIKGLRDHIAHGYFNLDAEIILDTVKAEIPELMEVLDKLKSAL